MRKMTANEWVGIAVGVCAVSTSLLLGLRWVIKSYLAELKPIQAHLLRIKLLDLKRVLMICLR
jgi:hypothetical protein